MNISELILLEIFTFLLLGLFAVLIFKKGMIRIPFSKEFNESKGWNQNLLDTPNLQQLLELEKFSCKEGSGITFDSLIGIWKFESVWSQRQEKEDSISSYLLKLFAASLSLSRSQINSQDLKFNIINSIRFGELLINFSGSGELKGSQPRLPFFFEKIEVKLGSATLFARSLNVPEEKDRPFFVLIAMGEDCQWLSARGRGGGLALWIKG